MVQPEEIGSDETVSRWIFRPDMIDDYEELMWKNIFQFQKKYECRESLVWHKHAPGLECVHRRGCAKKIRPERTYMGAVTTRVGRITCYRNQNGHGLFVEHIPKGGRRHANEKPWV